MERTERTERAIELSGLTKAFPGHLSIGSTTAVSDLDLEVTRGESFGLLGPNGAGKTTTLKMMLGLLRPDRGTIRLLGLEPRDPAARSRIGFLPENPYFYDYLTAEEFLDFYGRLQGIPSEQRRERVRRTLHRVGLEGCGGTALRKFSKGMIQRLGLAQAIQHEPELVILDEPMSGLDPIGRREVRDLILSLRDEGKTVFFSTHILQDAEMVCDRVAILKQGRLRSVGKLRELIGEKVQWFEVAIRGQLPEPCDAEVVSVEAGGHLLRVPDVEALTRLLAGMQNGRARVVSIWPRRETLEDLFLREVRPGEEER
jgi:ABC-2 type transport system ATP-binding protein